MAEIQTILDYQPFDYVTIESSGHGGMVVQTTTEIAPTDGGSHVSWRMGKPMGQNAVLSFLFGLLGGVMKGEMVREIQKAADRLRKIAEAEGHTDGSGLEPQPD